MIKTSRTLSKIVAVRSDTSCSRGNSSKQNYGVCRSSDTLTSCFNISRFATASCCSQSFCCHKDTPNDIPFSKCRCSLLLLWGLVIARFNSTKYYPRQQQDNCSLSTVNIRKNRSLTSSNNYSRLSNIYPSRVTHWYRACVNNYSNASFSQLHRNMSTTQHEALSPVTIFKGSRDRFGGVIVESQQESRDEQCFTSSLTESLAAWQREGVRGAWFNIHLQHAHWVPVLAKSGFEFHHAEGSTVVMVRWLPTDQPCAIPKYAHTVVGVGAMVVREDTGQILVVKERFHKRPQWKLPGGYVEKGEDLSIAAVREVLEETGVTAELVSVVAARHTHEMAFACSDLYFILHMRPSTHSITMCQQELSACQWMPLEEYRTHPEVHETNRAFVECFLSSREHGTSIAGTPLYSSVMNRQQVIYSVNHGSSVSQSGQNCQHKLLITQSTDDTSQSESSIISDNGTSSTPAVLKRDASCLTKHDASSSSASNGDHINSSKKREIDTTQL